MGKLNTDTLTEFKRDRDTYSPWGSSMAIFFDVAGELWWRGADIPGHWMYSPGAVDDPREYDSYYFDLIEKETNENLLALGNLLERHTRMLNYLTEE